MVISWWEFSFKIEKKINEWTKPIVLMKRIGKKLFPIALSNMLFSTNFTMMKADFDNKFTWHSKIFLVFPLVLNKKCI